MRSSMLLLGVMAAIWLPAGLDAAAAWTLAGLAVLSIFTVRWRPVLFAALGFLLASQAASRVMRLQVSCEERVMVTGEVVSVPGRQGSGWQFDALLRFPRQPARPDVMARITSGAQMQRPRAGERWQFALQLRGPGSNQRALLRDGINVEARMLKSALNRRLEPSGRTLPALREHIADRIDARVADPAAAALLAALAVGVTGDVSRQQWRVFNATGITHLVAISGMHVTFFAMLSMAMARRLWAMIPGVVVRVRREAFASAIGMVLATAYALLSGFSVPAQRTLVMLLAFLVAREAARASRVLWSVAVALVAVLLYDPLAVLSAGFWLSFLAVASIILVPGARLHAAGTLRSAASVQVVVSVALLPVTLLLFGTFSTAGLLVNALAIPVFTFLLVPPVLLATLGYSLGYLLPTRSFHWLADHLVDLAAWVASIGWPWLARTADLDISLLHATPVAAWYLLSIAAVTLVVMPWSPMLRALGAMLLLGAMLMRSPMPRQGELRLEVVDVGAATAAIVSTASRRLVFGTGETFGSRGRRFEDRVLRRLMNTGSSPADALIVGAISADRLRAVLAADALLGAGLVVSNAGRAGPPEIVGCAARSWTWDGVNFQLSPGPSGSSCVLWVQAGKRRVVLSQDALDASPADMILLPRNVRAQQAESIRQALREDGHVIASTDRREWQASRWLDLRNGLAAMGIVVRTTAEEGTLQFDLGIDSGIRLRNRGLRPGIWRRDPRDHSCAVGL